MNSIRLVIVTTVVSVLIGSFFGAQSVGQNVPARGKTEYELIYRHPLLNTENDGYGWFDVEIRSMKPAASVDEQFDIEFRLMDRGYYWSDMPREVVVDVRVTIPSGKTSGRSRVLFPAFVSNPGGVRVSVQQSGGQYWDKIEIWSNTQSTPRLLFIHDTELGYWNRINLLTRARHYETTGLAKGNRNQPPQLPSFHQINSGNYNDALSFLQATECTVQAILPAALPEHWAALSHFETVMISHRLWQQLAQQEFEKRDAIANWVRAGGRLVVYDLPNGLKDANSIRDSLGRSVSERRAIRNASWQDLTSVDLQQLYPGVPLDEMQYQIRQGQHTKTKVITSGNPVDAKSDSVVSRYGKGHLIVVSNNLSNWKMSDWQKVHVDLSGQMVYGYDNGCQANFLQSFSIPGVGQPPVIAFRLLIVIFVAVIGPLNYILLRRWRRLNLLLITVPVFSFLTCCGLLAYAMINDGFSLYGRIESFSRLDQRTGQIESQSRHKYFGARVPSAGYEFDKNSVALFSTSRNSKPVRVQERSDRYVVDGGEIRSRTAHQFYVKNVSYSAARIEFDRGDEGQLTATNWLGGQIQLLAVRDGENYYLARETDHGQSIALESIKADKAEVEFSQLVKKISPKEKEYYSDFSPSYYYPSSGGVEDFQTTYYVSELRNRQLTKLLDDHPNCYVVILSDFDSVPARSSDSKIRKQLHIVVGIWK